MDELRDIAELRRWQIEELGPGFLAQLSTISR
jgi:hypothetical protein